jgi:hypothetical protein
VEAFGFIKRRDSGIIFHPSETEEEISPPSVFTRNRCLKADFLIIYSEGIISD